MKSFIASLGVMLFLTLSSAANADIANPFGMSKIPANQTQLAEGKCGDSMKKAKCGNSMKNKEDGKCGDSMKKDQKEGKCGEGKCGGSMNKSENKPAAKCGEGKCGGK